MGNGIGKPLKYIILLKKKKIFLKLINFNKFFIKNIKIY